MAIGVPSLLLKQLYTFGSLQNTGSGVRFSVKNRLSDATLTGIQKVRLDGKDVRMDHIALELGNGEVLTPSELAESPIEFPLRQVVEITCTNLLNSESTASKSISTANRSAS